MEIELASVGIAIEKFHIVGIGFGFIDKVVYVIGQRSLSVHLRYFIKTAASTHHLLMLQNLIDFKPFQHLSSTINLLMPTILDNLCTVFSSHKLVNNLSISRQSIYEKKNYRQNKQLLDFFFCMNRKRT